MSSSTTKVNPELQILIDPSLNHNFTTEERIKQLAFFIDKNIAHLMRQKSSKY